MCRARTVHISGIQGSTVKLYPRIQCAYIGERTALALAYDGAIAQLIDAFAGLPGIGPKGAQRIAFYLLGADEVKAQHLADAIMEVKAKVRFCEICGNVCETSPCPICVDPRRDHSVICVVQEPKDVMSIERTREYRGMYHVLGGAIDPMANIGPADLAIPQLLHRLAPLSGDSENDSPAVTESEQESVTVPAVQQSLGIYDQYVHQTTSADDHASSTKSSLQSDQGAQLGEQPSEQSAHSQRLRMAQAQYEEVQEVILALNPNIEGDATTRYLAQLLGPLGITVTRLASGLPVGSDLEYADEITLGRAISGRRQA